MIIRCLAWTSRLVLLISLPLALGLRVGVVAGVDAVLLPPGSPRHLVSLYGLGGSWKIVNNGNDGYKSRFVNLSYLPSETGLDLSPKSAAHCWLLPEAPEEGGLLTFQHWFVDSQGLLLSQASSHHPGQPDLLGQSALTGLHEEEDPAVPVPGSSTSLSRTFRGVSCASNRMP